ncbi:conserved hypothetical protein [Leishmania braziliensis MHOM/BR/75/M2904]|uniref:Major facilitator superfamily (MFS) profile domain-containing protein n=1 Tax=Leishmania braziliensis TaxID=5660 RepID=A4HMU8_LEIBR|nr:conserved hypothetical protein [Leishmania braziliensis MHOM/BR/75/M2904]CAM43489.1 conserved hypothetical protein [Leishmania braziliensis MHOM/BR/75/M2904]
MAFVLLNESICSTMLLPFVGLLVAHLKGVSVNEAGYFSGILIGVFMLGQVVSSRMWGWVSDKYGRRFPLISGLFTSGFMMLGFGLSTSVWMCGIFRFMHGLFNGNVLVAKTMMADITDKTNAAKGFAFVSLCYGIGVLIGPTLGGTLHFEGFFWSTFDRSGLTPALTSLTRVLWSPYAHKHRREGLQRFVVGDGHHPEDPSASQGVYVGEIHIRLVYVDVPLWSLLPSMRGRTTNMQRRKTAMLTIDLKRRLMSLTQRAAGGTSSA